MNKMKLLVIILSGFLVIILLLYINSIEYSLADITSDNYVSKLTNIKKSLYKAQLDLYIPDKFPFIRSFEFANSDNYNNNGLRVKNNEGKWVEIHSNNTNINYYLSFNEGNMTYASIRLDEMNPNFLTRPHIKNLINSLILNESFTLMNSDLKNGFDIIIKETNDVFIIGHFVSFDEIQEPIKAITFETFSKKVFPIW